MSEANKGLLATAERRRRMGKGYKKWAESEYRYFSAWPGSERGWGPITRAAFDGSDFPGQDAIEIGRAS
jgi:hypothetical protein